ncbi:MAG: PIN domain-containing protein [Nitrososphaerales archaeon]
MQSLQSKLSIDSSVLIAYLLGEKSGEVAGKQIFQPGRVLLFNRLGLAEVFYTLCRKNGVSFAKESVTTFIQTNYCTFEDSHDLALEAGTYKCGRAISLADCYVIALAKLTGSTAVFAKREKEIVLEMGRKRFDVPIIFLEDFAKS